MRSNANSNGHDVAKHVFKRSNTTKHVFKRSNTSLNGQNTCSNVRIQVQMDKTHVQMLEYKFKWTKHVLKRPDTNKTRVKTFEYKFK